jgi:hypothetical protein
MNKFKQTLILISFFLIAILSLLLTINGLYVWIRLLINHHSYVNILFSTGAIVLLLFSGYLWWYVPVSKGVKEVIKAVSK